MKKVFLGILYFIFNYTEAQIKTQYFDGTDTSFTNSINIKLDTSHANIWQIGAPHKTIFKRASTVPNAIITDTINYYPSNNISIFKAKFLNDFSVHGMLALQWIQKLDLDTNCDGAIIELSLDNGQTWSNVFNNSSVYTFYGFDPRNKDTLKTGEYALSGTDTTWRNVWLCFDLYRVQNVSDTLNFRFTLKSDSIDNHREGWMIDNMFAQNTYFVHPVKNVGKRNHLTVFPNPSNRIINIELEKMANIDIIDHMELINSHGKVVDEWNNIPTKFGFDANKYGDGSYFLKVRVGKRTETTQIVVGIH